MLNKYEKCIPVLKGLISLMKKEEKLATALFCFKEVFNIENSVFFRH